MQLRPFNSLRPPRELVQNFSCPPYDVIDRAEARAWIAERPESFLKVTRSDADLPEDIDAHSKEVYALARQNLDVFLDKGSLLEEQGACLYVYRQAFGEAHIQTGVVGCVSVADYESGAIRVHEKTRPEKVRDRTEHMLATGLHAEAVFLAYRSNEEIVVLIKQGMNSDPIYDFTSDDGVRHTLWKVPTVKPLVNAFERLSTVYIADGHHRAESAKICCHELGMSRRPVSAAGYFLAVLFPHDELRILPYNRIIKRLPAEEESIHRKIKRAFEIEKTDTAIPPFKGSFCMFLGKSWYLLKPKERAEKASPVDVLDVSVLAKQILRPIFGIEDERTDANIEFVGGVHGPARLEDLVLQGRAACAFSLFPVSIDELFQVADAGLLMPPKSTWFEPKLRSGLFMHSFMEVGSRRGF